METKRSSLELFLKHLKENGTTAAQMVERFKHTGHPVDKSISALSRVILKKKNNRATRHFNADASNTELLFRIIHSVNQLSICGAVSNWCEQFGLTEEEKGQEQPPGKKESVTKGVLTSVKSHLYLLQDWYLKQFAGKDTGLRITVRDNSIHKGTRRRNFRASGCSWYEL